MDLRWLVIIAAAVIFIGILIFEYIGRQREIYNRLWMEWEDECRRHEKEQKLKESIDILEKRL